MSEINSRKTSDMQQWVSYGVTLKLFMNLEQNLQSQLNGNVPKSVYNPHMAKIREAICDLQGDLEDRMIEEHPDEWNTSVFYGPLDD